MHTLQSCHGRQLDGAIVTVSCTVTSSRLCMPGCRHFKTEGAASHCPVYTAFSVRLLPRRCNTPNLRNPTISSYCDFVSIWFRRLYFVRVRRASRLRSTFYVCIVAFVSTVRRSAVALQRLL